MKEVPMLSKRALGLAAGLAVLPQMVHAGESAAHCVDASAEAALEGLFPRWFSVKRLTELPMLWSEQWRAVGLREPIQVRAELG
jgi:hypothetical protein